MKKFEFETTTTKSRKRRVVKAKKPKSGRNVKRPRIASSSEDEDESESDSLDEWFENVKSSASEDTDSEDEYVPAKRSFKSKLSNGANARKRKLDSESETDPESDISDDEERDQSQSGERSASDDSSSDSESVWNRQRQSKEKYSKVQEYLRGRYQSSKKKTVKDDALKNDIIEGVRELKAELLHKIEVLGERLPKNTLDELVNKLGGSEKVAEMTGRKV